MTDDAARRRIEHDLDTTLFVEAGAGTGKTTALVSRVVRLVATGRVTDLARLAAITFTEAAAAELRERVRTGLEDAAGRPDLDPAERARCAAGAATVDAATITTLHGFAARILAEHPLEAGVPPGFEVVDEVAERVELDERWRSFLAALLEDPALAPALSRAFTLRLTTRHLRAVADAFHASWDRLAGGADTVAAHPAVDAGPVLAELEAACAHVGRHPDDDSLARYLRNEVAAFRDRLVAADGELEVLRALDSQRLRPGGKGTAAVWGPDKAVVVAAVQRAETARAALLDEVRTAALTTVLPPIRRFVLDLAAERRTAGRLAFHDLLVLARDLLRDDREVRVALSGRWDRLLLDEFQDTDPLQIEIAALLALRDPAAHPPPAWDRAELVPGKLFLVGDPKQSIYRFRRADIALYDQAAGLFDDGLVRLSRNFRTVPSVLGWVNRTFGSIIGPGQPGAQPAYVDLEPARDEHGSEPAVGLVGGPVPQAPMAVVREREADAVAATIRRMRDDLWSVAADDGGTRPLRFADVALLVPTRTPLGAIERALDAADVPYRIESRSLVFATDEVRELLAVLEAVDDPGDQVAVVAALRSPAFACADDELAEWRAAGGRWDPRRPPPDGLAPDHPVAEAMAALAELHERRWWEPVPALVARLVRERRLVALTTAHPRPRDHWRRIRFVVDQARAWSERGGLDLGGFVTWARRQADEDARVLEVVAPEEDDDAVRILTVHGAKGLEFPAVVLAGLGGGADPRPATVLWGTDGPEVAVGSREAGARFATPGYDDRRLGEARMDELEGHRLLYVAATRARDHLVVSLYHKPSGNGRRSWAELLTGLCTGDDAGCRRLPDPPVHDGDPHTAPVQLTLDGMPAAPRPAPVTVPGPVRLGPPRRGPVPTADEAVAARAAWLATVGPAVAATHRPAAVVATALTEVTAPGRDGDGRPPASLASLASGADRGGAAVGRAVHAVLETVDLRTGAGIDRLAVAAAAAEGIGSRAGLVARLADAGRRAPVVQAAVAGGRWWREVPVSAPVAGGVVEGVVDLVVEDADGGLVVVDYKTDAVAGDADVDAAVAHHRLQAAAYAVALGSALDRPVSRAVLVFARPDGPLEREIPDLPAAMEEVVRIVGADA